MKCSSELARKSEFPTSFLLNHLDQSPDLENITKNPYGLPASTTPCCATWHAHPLSGRSKRKGDSETAQATLDLRLPYRTKTPSPVIRQYGSHRCGRSGLNFNYPKPSTNPQDLRFPPAHVCPRWKKPASTTFPGIGYTILTSGGTDHYSSERGVNAYGLVPIPDR